MEQATTPRGFRPGKSLSGRGAADHQFADAIRGITIDGKDRVYAVGDSVVKVFDSAGKLLRQWSTAQPGFCVAVDEDGHVWVGGYRQIEIFDPEGNRVDVWREPEGLGLVTAIALGPEDVFLADATARWIHRYDRKRRLRNEIGDRHRKGGFHIPNGIVDFALDGDGILHVANPGMHRVERYKADGELLGHFGRFDGVDPAGFPGCCNPTNVTLDADGRVFVTEKAGPRAKVYSADGQLLTVVADEGFDPAAKNMDLAVDSRGRIYVVDTVKLEIRIFEPQPVEGEA